MGYLYALQFEFAGYLFGRPSFLDKQLHGTFPNTGLERCVPNYTLPSFLRHLICQPGTVAASLVTVAFEFATDGRRRNLFAGAVFPFNAASSSRRRFNSSAMA